MALVDALGRPIRLMLTAGQVHDSHGARELLVELDRGTVVVGDKAYDADWIRALIKQQGAVANTPNRPTGPVGVMEKGPLPRAKLVSASRKHGEFISLLGCAAAKRTDCGRVMITVSETERLKLFGATRPKCR